ncbi:FKBP-type peptidyl-prolyl cis-trans isomerase [Deminuibacter soli]|nr:FKBP-type peptidyl-prolyl cis-trans isomerase [Deminuibacter soli]
MKQFLLGVAAFAMFAMTACQGVNYEKTKSGLTYKIIKGKGGEKLKGGTAIKFNIFIGIPEADTTFATTFDKMPGFLTVDSSQRGRGTFMELLPLCSVGDSLIFKYSVDTLKKLGAIPDYNKTFTRGGFITGRIKILKAYKAEADMVADYQNEVQSETNREIATIEGDLSKMGVKAQKSKKGTFVVVSNPGDQSNKADSGKQALVMYRGYLFNAKGGEKKVFDTNMDTTKGHTQPYPVVVGQSQVIAGWHEALPFFGKGGKGTIYVPAMLGYQNQAMPGIPAYSTLVFDIEVTDVTTPAPAAAQPGFPGGAMPQQPGQQPAGH